MVWLWNDTTGWCVEGLPDGSIQKTLEGKASLEEVGHWSYVLGHYILSQPHSAIFGFWLPWGEHLCPLCPLCHSLCLTTHQRDWVCVTLQHWEKVQHVSISLCLTEQSRELCGCGRQARLRRLSQLKLDVTCSTSREAPAAFHSAAPCCLSVCSPGWPGARYADQAAPDSQSSAFLYLSSTGMKGNHYAWPHARLSMD